VFGRRVPRVCAYETNTSHIIYDTIDAHVAYRIRLEASEGARDSGNTITVAISVKVTRVKNIVVGKNNRSDVMDSLRGN
jgi:hypothetical protein